MKTSILKVKTDKLFLDNLNLLNEDIELYKSKVEGVNGVVKSNTVMNVFQLEQEIESLKEEKGVVFKILAAYKKTDKNYRNALKAWEMFLNNSYELFIYQSAAVRDCGELSEETRIRCTADLTVARMIIDKIAKTL